MAEKDITAIIPARAGSKGIKDKNIINFCGKPLIAWSVEQALQSKHVSSVYVSTDGERIAEISEKCGAKIIWRPSELCSDTSSSESAIIHAVNEIRKKDKTDADTVLFLQVTSPVRLTGDIDGAIEVFLREGYDSLFSMSILEDYCLWKRTDKGLQSFSYDYLNRGRRQDRAPLYLENGSIYLFRTEILMSCGNRLGGKTGMFEMPFDRSFEIDREEDIELCSYFMKKYYGGRTDNGQVSGLCN